MLNNKTRYFGPFINFRGKWLLFLKIKAESKALKYFTKNFKQGFFA